MKNKVIMGIGLVGVLLLSAGCFKRDTMEDITIYTTTYPIEYITESLYGDYSTVKSIYPNSVDVYNYSLTEKQINDYAKSEIFVYNGLTDEKLIAKSFINQNHDLDLIDVSYGLSIEYGTTPEELWLSPNNYLMLATTVKNNLEELITSKYINQKIDENYSELQEQVSILDANLRSIGATAKAKGTNTIVVTNNTFKYLENYGFNVISIEEEKNYTNDLKNKYKNGTYKYLFVKEGETSDKITELTDTYKASIIYLNPLDVLTDEQRKNGDNYISIMKDYIEKISKLSNE